MRLREPATALVVVAPFVAGLTGGSGPEANVEFRFQDPAIVESSGLVVQDGLFVTANDSGDSGRVFAVDPTSGRTVGVTTWAGEPRDVEALAPAGPGEVWVGDIGDNLADRPTVEVTRVPVGRGPRSVDEDSFQLVNPEGPADAEALLAHPVTGRLYLVDKAVFGGTLYAAPAELSDRRPNRLRPVGGVLPIATDGAFFPDGRHLVLRDYSRAVIYTFPGLETLARVRLPRQEQGEGIAVAADGAVFVSTEGQRSPVHGVRLPTAVRNAVTPPAPEPEPADSPTSRSREDVELPEEDATAPDPWQWLMGGLLFVGAVLLLVRAVRPR